MVLSSINGNHSDSHTHTFVSTVVKHLADSLSVLVMTCTVSCCQQVDDAVPGREYVAGGEFLLTEEQDQAG